MPLDNIYHQYNPYIGQIIFGHLYMACTVIIKLIYLHLKRTW
jgi:hypothetical protein